MTGGQVSLGFDVEARDDNRDALLEVQRIDSSQPLPRWQPDAAARAANRQYVEFLATQHDDPAWK